MNLDIGYITELPPVPTRTIAVGAQLANGKDTFADYLVTQLNLRYPYPHNLWTRNAFANSLKQVFCDSFGVDRDFIEQWKRETSPPPGFDMTVRDCLIGIGDGFRKMKANLWIENAFRNQEHDQIISDCRYVNEVEHVRNLGGLTVLMWRPGFENDIPNRSEQEFLPFIKVLRDIDLPDGAIPADLDIPFDLWFKNDGDVEHMYRKIDNIVLPYVDDFFAIR